MAELWRVMPMALVIFGVMAGYSLLRLMGKRVAYADVVTDGARSFKIEKAVVQALAECDGVAQLNPLLRAAAKASGRSIRLADFRRLLNRMIARGWLERFYGGGGGELLGEYFCVTDKGLRHFGLRVAVKG